MKTILVVDDEGAIRELYNVELTAQGHRVVTAPNAEEALQKITEKHPDLVTVDIRLPGMDGITLVRKIKDKNPNLPVILVTAYETYKHDFASWAADAYVVKSSDTRELKETVSRLLSR